MRIRMANRIGKRFLTYAEQRIGDAHRYAVRLARGEGGNLDRSSRHHASCSLLEGSQQPDGLQEFGPECGNTPPGFLMAAAHHAGGEIELAVDSASVVNLIANR